MNASVPADSMYLTVVSETERVAVILEHLSSYARLQGLGDSNGLLLVVRELVMNAIVHGNGSNPSRVALIRVTPRAGYFEVQVDDEGRGFDFASLILVLPDDPQTLSGRGLVLVHELSRDLKFERGGARVMTNVYPDGKTRQAVPA